MEGNRRRRPTEGTAHSNAGTSDHCRTSALRRPARLHLGFLDLNGGLGRTYGSIGLAVDAPATEISVTRAADFAADRAPKERACSPDPATERRSLGLSRPLPRRGQAPPFPPMPASAPARSSRLPSERPSAASKGSTSNPQSSAISPAAARARRSAWRPSRAAASSSTAAGRQGSAAARPRARRFPRRLARPPRPRPEAQGAHGDREAKAFAALPPFPEATGRRPLPARAHAPPAGH